tara:strand:- start:11903 stop:13573 length:1671 start_codon:yes stop_codon:yes gene_type:complete
METLSNKSIKNIKKFLYKILFFVTFYYSSITLYLTYSIIDSPDFSKYYNYFLFYSGNIESLNLEQGHIYFFINYIILYFFSATYEFFTLNELLNLSIHFVNSFIFLFGCLGLIKFLSNKYKVENIYLILSILCITPPAMELRVTLKPEILAFAAIGWLLYYIDLISEQKKTIYFINLILLFSIVITSKISIAILISIILIFNTFLNNKNLIKQINLKHIILFFVIIVGLLFENYKLNNQFITTVEHEEKYNNTANINFFHTFNSREFIDNPNKYFFYDSFLGITLFDTFNDFFGFYSNSEHTELNKDRKSFFKVVFRGGQVLPINVKFDKAEKTFTFSGLYDRGWNESNYIDEIRLKISFVFSAIFYFMLFLFAVFNREIRIIMLSPFISLFILSLSALGVFGTKNFDPNTGDSFKSFYYGFFVLVCFVILLCEVFKHNYFRKIISIVLVLLMLFFIGFPFNYTQANEESVTFKNSYLPFCEINTPVINTVLSIKKEVQCNNDDISMNLISPDSNLDSLSFKFKKFPFFNLLLLVLYFSLFFTKIRKSNLLELIND